MFYCLFMGDIHSNNNIIIFVWNKYILYFKAQYYIAFFRFSILILNKPRGFYVVMVYEHSSFYVYVLFGEKYHIKILIYFIIIKTRKTVEIIGLNH